MQISKENLSSPSVTLSILELGLHGGFIEQEDINEEQLDFCEQTDWIKKVVRFKCGTCNNWHTISPGEKICLQTQQSADSIEEKKGYRVIVDSQLDLKIEEDYDLFLKESSSSIETATLPYKSIVFVPDENDMVFSDRAGSTIVLPLEKLPEFVDETSRKDFIENINEKRKRLVDWDRLDPEGGDFEKILFRLMKRDGDYFNGKWGGSGPDQGKDGFCSIDLGGRETRVLVQAKFNNEGSAINDRQVEKSCRKAERHDCRGVIIGTVKTSGDLESEFEAGTLQSKSVHYLRIWSGPEIKEKLSEHPDIIAELFLE